MFKLQEEAMSTRRRLWAYLQIWTLVPGRRTSPTKKNTPESPYPATTFLNFVDKEGERA